MKDVHHGLDAIFDYIALQMKSIEEISENKHIFIGNVMTELKTELTIYITKRDFEVFKDGYKKGFEDGRSSARSAAKG